MGYYMSQRNADFCIEKKNIPACFKVIKEMNKGDWVKNIKECENIKDVFDAWRWEIMFDETGNINDILFQGEKLGDDEVFFQTIAPYVKDGSHIEMSGEEDAIWQWLFNNGKFEEKYANLDWDESGEILKKILEKKELLPLLIGIHPSLDEKIENILKGDSNGN